MKKLLIANWKMNLGCKAGAKLVNNYESNLRKSRNKDFVILPSSQSIYYILSKVNNKNLNFGAQDCSQFNLGAYTGDISAAMIKELGCKFVLLGHSERRKNYGENNKVLKLKLKNAMLNNLKVIFCIGENLIDYKNGKTKKVIRYQLEGLFDKDFNFKNLIIAYEPVWAIGSNRIPKLYEIDSMHGFIKKTFSIKYNVKNICVIYGGSVNLANSKAIFSTENVDGGLVGGASLIANEFKGIYANL